MTARRGRFVVAAAFLAASGLWVAIKTFGSDGEDAAPPAVPVRAVTHPASTGPGAGGAGDPASAGPADDEWGVPVGYRNGEPGARAAAVGWVAALGPLMRMGPVATGDTLRALMSDQAATDTIATFRDERSRFARQFGADPANAIWVESPLQVDVVEIGDASATVRVWSQLLVGVPTDSVQVLWRTQTISLVWEGDDWRVADVSRVEGPTPLTVPGALPASGGELAAVAGWTPAVWAGTDVRGGP